MNSSLSGQPDDQTVQRRSTPDPTLTPERWQRICDIFDLALAVEPAHDTAARLAVIDRECAGDVPLRDAVLRLLREHESTGGLLDQPLFEAESPHVLQPKQVLAGRFEIGSFAGAGGMGEVYRAFDRTTGERLALKTLRAGAASAPEFIDRLRKELVLARRVSHRNICRVYELGRAPGPSGAEITFLTMELIDGPTLSQVMRERRLTLEEAEEIALQVIEGLGAAHDAGIIHRDLKSGNIMLAKDSAGRTRPVITDFGLARPSEGQGDTRLLFATGAIVGTPAYMAPEQLNGQPLTIAADLHALGVVFFEMVTGRLPFEADTPLALGLKRLQEDAPSPRKFADELPARWDAVIRACLERDPAHRPASARDVAALLTGKVKPPIRIRRRWVIAASSVAAIAAASPFAWPVLRDRFRFVNPDAAEHLALGDDFTRRRTKEGLENAVVEYNKALQIEPNYPEAYAGLADAYSAMASYAYMEPRKALAEAKNAARRAIAMNDRLARGHGALGYAISIDLQEWLTAEPYFIRAVSLDPREPNVRLWYGAYLGKLGRFDEAISQIRAGIRNAPSSVGLSHQLATTFFWARRFDEMLSQALEVVRLQPSEPSAHLGLARALEWKGRYVDARVSIADARRLAPSMTAVLAMEGSLSAAEGDLAAARKIAMEIENRWRQKEQLESSMLAALWARLNEPDKAFEILDAGFERFDTSLLSALVNPYLEVVHKDPRWQAFRKRLGLR